MVIWCVRLCAFAVVCITSTYWLAHRPVAVAGQMLFGGVIVMSSGALIASFVRSRGSLVVVALSTIATPLILFLLMDILILRGAWWEWYMVVVQMGIPVGVAYYMWKAPVVRNYYLQKQQC